MHLFGLNEDNSIGLDSVVHGLEYRQERKIDSKISKTEKRLCKKERQLQRLIEAEVHETDQYDTKREIKRC
jgi:hypothetical protein